MMLHKTELTSVLRWGLTAIALLAMPLAAQEYRATIMGSVTDASGAVVPNSQIEARNVATSGVTSARSNEVGAYTIPFLSPGTYDLTATASGFKQAVRKSIELHAGDKVQSDLRLQLGSLTESVTVTALSEQLKTATASMGQTTNAEQIRDLPSMGRNTYMAAALSTGIYSSAYVGRVSSTGLAYGGGANGLNVEGLQGSYQITLNGIPNDPVERASGAIYTGFVPAPDAVEEVTLQTHTYDAQYGHSTGAVLNAVLKGGTNQLHGSAYEFLRNEKLNANSFEGNAAGNARGVVRWNQPGFVVDGPVRLPKIYDGRDKTFFMFSMELERDSNPSPFVGSFPTAPERTGDFSGLTTSGGAKVVIYDPMTTVLTNGQYLRQPFGGNVVPKSRINPIGQTLINMAPLPNIAGTAGGFSNYVDSPNSMHNQYHSVSSRVDHQIDQRNRLTMMGFSTQRNNHAPTAGFSDLGASPGQVSYRNTHGASVDWTNTLTPTAVVNVKYGFVFHPFGIEQYSDNYDISKLGFSQSFISQVPHVNFPGIQMSGGYTGLTNSGALSNGSSASQFSTTLDHSLSGTINKTLGRHTLKAGGEMLIMFANNEVPVSNINPFTFSSGFTQQNAQSASATAGNPFTSLLLGWPSGGGVSNNIASAWKQSYYGYFVQDDWRATPRLTFNLGLRWEYESPMSERYNRQNRGFAFDATNPLQAQVPSLTLKGGLLFTDSNNRLPFVRDLNNWAPRIGAAYRLFNNTVLRGGFGTMYSVTFDPSGSNGFSATTNYVASNDNGLTPANGLLNPFPGGILAPSGSGQELATLVGQSFTFADPGRTIPKVYNYSFGIQQLLPQNTLLEIAYAGNSASQLAVSKNVNVLPRQYFALPGQTPPVPSATLLGQVKNPMAGLLPGSSLNNATTAYQNLLLPFPEFGALTESAMPIGTSLYNSMQVSVEKRLSAGLQGRMSFTWNKTMVENAFLNTQDTHLTRLQQGTPTKMLTLNVSYALPIFANSKRFLHNVLGGWEAHGILRYMNGNLFGAPSGAYSTGVNPKLSDRSYKQWFNTCSLNTSGVRQNCASPSQPVAFIQAPPNTLRTLSTNLPGIRSEIPTIVDFSLFKTFWIHEKIRLQFRANAYNLANTPMFGGPGTGFGSANFGLIGIAQANDPRNVELALKLNF